MQQIPIKTIKTNSEEHYTGKHHKHVQIIYHFYQDKIIYLFFSVVVWIFFP